MPAKVPEVIKCDATTFAYELESIQESIAQPETEDSWDVIGRSIQRWTALVKGGAPSPDLIAALRQHSRSVIRSINSERTILSGHAVALLEQSVLAVGIDFDQLCALYVPVLLNLTARTIKLYITRAKACLLTIVEEVRPPSILSQLRHSVGSKSVTLRLAATELTASCLNSFNPTDLAKETRAKDIENIIKVTASDANPEVRKVSRTVYEAYNTLLPDRVPEFVRPLTPTTRKYLGVKGDTLSKPSSRPASSMSRPISRAEPARAPQSGVRSHLQHSRVPSSSSMDSAREAARSPPLVAPKSMPAPPAPLVKAQRVIAIAAADPSSEEDHVRSNSLRGGALNSGASNDRPTFRGPARVVSNTYPSEGKDSGSAPGKAPGLKPQRVVPAVDATSGNDARRDEITFVPTASALSPTVAPELPTIVPELPTVAPGPPTVTPMPVAVSPAPPSLTPVPPASALTPPLSQPKRGDEEAEVAVEPEHPVKPVVQRDATTNASRSTQPPPPTRARVVSALKPAEAAPAHAPTGPRRMERPAESSELFSSLNAKSSGPVRAAPPVARQVSRTVVERPPSAATDVKSTKAASAAQVGSKASTATPSTESLKTSVREKPATASTSKAAVISRPAAPIKSTAPSKPAVTKAPVPIQRTVSSRKAAEPASKPSVRTHAPRSISASAPKAAPTPNPASTSTDARTRSSAPRDLTRPTASQLARSQSSAPTHKDAKKAEKPKPTWGRAPAPAPRKPVPTTATRSRPLPRVRPETVPLPSSPKLKAKKAATKAVKKAAAVPLPPSPGVQASTEVEADEAVPSLELDAAGDAPVVVLDDTSSPAKTSASELSTLDKKPVESHPVEVPTAVYPAEPPPEVDAVSFEDKDGDDDDDNDDDDFEDDDSVVNIPTAVYPIDEPTIKFADHEYDIAGLQASEDTDFAFSDDDDISAHDGQDDERLHIRVDSEDSEDMQLSAVVEHVRGFSDELTMHPHMLAPHTPAKLPMPALVPATPISTLLSSIQDGFHMPLSPPQTHMERAAARPLEVPAGIPLSFSSASLMASQLFAAKPAASTPEEGQNDRAVLGHKQL